MYFSIMYYSLTLSSGDHCITWGGGGGGELNQWLPTYES